MIVFRFLLWWWVLRLRWVLQIKSNFICHMCQIQQVFHLTVKSTIVCGISLESISSNGRITICSLTPKPKRLVKTSVNRCLSRVGLGRSYMSHGLLSSYSLEIPRQSTTQHQEWEVSVSNQIKCYKSYVPNTAVKCLLASPLPPMQFKNKYRLE